MSRQDDIARDVEAVKRAADSQGAGRGQGFPPVKGFGTDGFDMPGDCSCPDLATLDPACPQHGGKDTDGTLDRVLSAAERADRERPEHRLFDGSTPADHAGHGCSADPLKHELPDDENETPPGDVIHPAWYEPGHPDAPRYTHAEIGTAADPDEVTSLLARAKHAAPTSTGEHARAICEEAADLVNGDRNADYGDALDNFTETGALWAVVFGHPVSAEQVALCLDLVKTARLIHHLDHADSWVDKVGYSSLGGGIVKRRADLDN